MASLEEGPASCDRPMSSAVCHQGPFLALPNSDIITFAFERLGEHGPDQVIFAEASNVKSCVRVSEVELIVEQIAAQLKSLGVKKGDCVCIHSFNSIWYPLVWLAIIAAGGIVTGSNPAYTAIELIHHIKVTDAKFLITQKIGIAAVEAVLSECDIAATRVFVLERNPHSKWHHLTSLEEQTPENDENTHSDNRFNSREFQESCIAVHATTSGTTGLPKAAELSHRYLVAQATILENTFSKRSTEISQIICLPIFHAFAAQLTIVLPLRLGITTYFMPRFQLPDFVKYIHRFQITDTAIVPPIASALLTTAPPLLDSLRYVICAGAPMTASVQTKLSSKLHLSATIAQCWGTTELGWVTSFGPYERDKSGSVGCLLPNTQLKILDHDGSPTTADNVSGEALVKSASILKCYHNRPDMDSEIFDHEGFYRTGDRVFVQKGKIFIVGRIKDTMKVNGWQVSPEEIESVILQFDGVKDCAVVGYEVVNEKTMLQETRPRAFIVRQPGSTVDGNQIQTHVREHLVRYKRLTGGVVFVDRIPRSNTGKILRRCLLRAIDDNSRTSIPKRDLLDGFSFRHAAVAVLIPLCCSMGLPGLVLMFIAFSMFGTGHPRKV